MATPVPRYDFGFLSKVRRISFPAPHMDIADVQIVISTPTRPYPGTAILGPSVTFQKTIGGTPYKITGDVPSIAVNTGSPTPHDQVTNRLPYEVVTGNSGSLPYMFGVKPFTANMVKKVYSWTTVGHAYVADPGVADPDYVMRCYLMYNLSLIGKTVVSPFEFTLTFENSDFADIAIIIGIHRTMKDFVMSGTNLLTEHGGVTAQPGSNMGWPDAAMVYHANCLFKGGNSSMPPFFESEVTSVARVSINLANYVVTITADTVTAPQVFSASGAPGPD